MAVKEALLPADIGRLYKNAPEAKRKTIISVFVANYVRLGNVLNAICGNGKSHTSIALQLVNDHDG